MQGSRLLIELIGAQQAVVTAQPVRELSASTAYHAMAGVTHGSVDMALVGPGVVAIVTTFYSLLYLVRPGEKTQITSSAAFLEDSREGSHDRRTATANHWNGASEPH